MSGDSAERSVELTQGLTRLFELEMRDGRTPPLEALEHIARALGALYQDVASAHRDPAACPCGWVPTSDDLVRLAGALRGGSSREAVFGKDLRTMTPAGYA